MRDPFEQARRNRYALLDAMEERTNRRVHRGLLVHGDVVVFPQCRYSGSLPHNASKETFLDARDLDELPERIESAFSAWRRQSVALSLRQFTEVQEALLPSLRLIRCASTQIASERRRLVQISHAQQTALMGLLANHRVLVEGVAGSGKTLLALEFALNLASKGQRVLMLCYNRELMRWLTEQVEGDERFRGGTGRLELSTFHSYALSLARRARVEFDGVDRGHAFWAEEVPLILEQAIAVLSSAGVPEVFDSVIVDEAQDFEPDWWFTIEALTRNGSRGRLFVFLDLHQSLRGDGTLPPVELPARFSLTTNCRNTKAIARSAAAIVRAQVTILEQAPEGEQPVLRRQRSGAECAGIVLAEVRRFLNDGIEARQIALIGPATLSGGVLKAHRDVDGVPLISSAADWRHGGGVLVTTARSFKGLEADIVIVYDLTTFGPQFSIADLYVAWTRARHRLIAVCHGDEVRATVEAALAVREPMLVQ